MPSHPVSVRSARALVDRLEHRPVLIIGDVMLDHFVIGRVTRISPEAPVPVVEFDHDQFRLGGAANVAHNVRALGGRASLVGVVGADEAAERLRADLEALGIGTDGLVTDPRRPTTRKLRVVTTRNQQVARIDYESDNEVESTVTRDLLEAVERQVRQASAVVISDYLKGSITTHLVAQTIAVAHGRDLPVLVDPKVPHIDRYAGATLITPNHHEAEAVTLIRIRTTDDVRAAARAFRRRTACASVLITRGEHGMFLLEGRDSRATDEAVIVGEHDLPAVAREVSDVTGAGDTVVATIALGLAAGGTLLDAAFLANQAAGIVVGRFGPATVSRAELMADLPAE